MIKNFAAVLVTIVYFFLPSTACSEKLIIVTGPFPPYHYEQNGKQMGINADIAREVFKKMGIEPEFHPEGFKRALKSVQKGDAAAFVSLIYVKDLAEYMYYTSEPLNVLTTVIMARKKNPIKINTFDDLKNKFIGVVKGYSYGLKFNTAKYLKKQIYEDDKELIRAFERGRMDLAAAHKDPFIFISKQLGFKDKFEVAYVLLEEPMFVTFSKTLGQKGIKLRNKFDKTLRIMKKKGIVQKMMMTSNNMK